MSLQQILVTGASSPLGQAIGKEIRLRGHYAIGTIRRDPIGVDLSMFDRIQHVDLTRPDQIQALDMDFDSVIHAAADSVGTHSDLMASVALSTGWLIDRALRSGASSCIHVSSMAVYGEISEDVVSPSTSIRHTRPYGAAKWAAECFLHDRRVELPAVSVRSPAIVGRQSHRNFLAVLLRSLIEQREAVTVSNPNFSFNNVIHEDTLAKFLVHLAVTTSSGFVAVPVGSGKPLDLSEVVKKMVEATNYQGRVDWVPSPSRPFSISIDADCSLGFRPLTTDQTLYRWLRNI